jgi:protein-S-isoprenylcysteine O-methyltransferase Ste14
MTRAELGGWLFRHRTALPLPLAVVILVFPPSHVFTPAVCWALGGMLVAAGEALRLWAVRHIGAISRTRSDRLGPLVATGPFSRLRNPLYIGNILLWSGFALSARAAWLVPFVAIILALEYHAIIAWEEQLLLARLGQTYRDYATRVPRWVPSARRTTVGSQSDGLAFSWTQTLFSERGTLIAIAGGYGALCLKLLLLGSRF